jgi:DNA-binding MarR family transcriptional regulator
MKKDSKPRTDLNTDEKVLMAIVRAAEIFKRAHSAVFRNHGLSFPQYNVLRVLESSGNGHNKISDVSRIMLVPGANMTGIVKRLAKAGFIVRKSDPKDDRVTMLQISAKGKRTLQNIEREKDEWLDVLLKGFSRVEKVDLLGKVGQLIKNNIQGIDDSFIQREELRWSTRKQKAGSRSDRPMKPAKTQPKNTAHRR